MSIQRKELEKIATQRALHFGLTLTKVNGRYHSVSPTAYYYVSDKTVNYNNNDCVKFRKLSEKIHNNNSERALLEKEIIKICPNKIKWAFEIWRFHDAKNFSLLTAKNENPEEFEGENINKINRFIKLLKKWELLSQNEHYKLSNAEKRIAKKNERG